MIGSHEGLGAYLAGKLLLARMYALVPMQLIGAGKFARTEGEITGKWLLARVPSQVGLQVAGFSILLAAAGMMADM